MKYEAFTPCETETLVNSDLAVAGVSEKALQKGKKRWKNPLHLAFALHHSFHLFWSHLRQCEMSINSPGI